MKRWLLAAAQDGMSARTRNRYLSALSAFANWCVLDGRLAGNPVSRVTTTNERTDPRRQRRSLTEAELKRLLDAAQRRPLDDALRVQRGPRKGELAANLTPERRTALKKLGRERALIYKTMVRTGLRKGELASITSGQCHLDGDAPYIELAAADEKNGEGATVPVRADLAHELRGWISESNLQSGRATILSIHRAGDPAD
ncbi:MAG: tyrosine-type recombinase/integrase [Maioricimonas sp. JB049]